MARTGRKGVWVALAMAAAVAFGAIPAVVRAEEVAAPLTVQNGMQVGMDYVLTVGEEVVDSSEGKQPLQFQYGSGQIIPGLERQLAGMKVGDSKEVTVAPEDGYGSYEPDRVIEISKEQMPSDLNLEVGAVLGGVDAQGHPIRGTVKEIKEQNVVMDMNHPLAGKTLQFKVTIRDITPAQ